VILHHAIKTIQNGVFPFSLKEVQNLVSFQKTGFFKKKNKKKQVGCFFKKSWFFSTLLPMP